LIEVGIVGVVEEAARVIEQILDRDCSAVRDEPGEPPFDAVIEPDFSLGDQLQHEWRRTFS